MTFEKWISGMTVKSLMRSGIRKAWDAGQAAEREACAVVAETYPAIGPSKQEIAAAIRARGKEG
ncbi:MAG: hypothetical protein ACYTBJ_25320 [Planctomycetota bacterium]|jgi:hypothetical protein